MPVCPKCHGDTADWMDICRCPEKSVILWNTLGRQIPEQHESVLVKAYHDKSFDVCVFVAVVDDEQLVRMNRLNLKCTWGWCSGWDHELSVWSIVPADWRDEWIYTKDLL